MGFCDNEPPRQVNYLFCAGRMLPVWALVAPTVVCGLLKYIVAAVTRKGSFLFLMWRHRVEEERQASNVSSGTRSKMAPDDVLSLSYTWSSHKRERQNTLWVVFSNAPLFVSKKCQVLCKVGKRISQILCSIFRCRHLR